MNKIKKFFNPSDRIMLLVLSIIILLLLNNGREVTLDQLMGHRDYGTLMLILIRTVDTTVFIINGIANILLPMGLIYFTLWAIYKLYRYTNYINQSNIKNRLNKNENIEEKNF